MHEVISLRLKMSEDKLEVAQEVSMSDNNVLPKLDFPMLGNPHGTDIS